MKLSLLLLLTLSSLSSFATSDDRCNVKIKDEGGIYCSGGCKSFYKRKYNFVKRYLNDLGYIVVDDGVYQKTIVIDRQSDGGNWSGEFVFKEYKSASITVLDKNFQEVEYTEGNSLSYAYGPISNGELSSEKRAVKRALEKLQPCL
jgi:hypothetical protein